MENWEEFRESVSAYSDITGYQPEKLKKIQQLAAIMEITIQHMKLIMDF